MLNPCLCLFLHSLLLPKPRTSVQREGDVREGGLMAGHMGKASSTSVCQPTWLLLWQACPRQDHRRGPPVGLQQGSPASPSPLEHPSFHLRPGGPHPALQPSAPRCHCSPSCSAPRWNNSIVFHCLPCCVCNRNGLGACFFILIYFSAFACLVLRLQDFKSGSEGTPASSGVRVFLGNKSQSGLFTVTALMWCDCSSFHLCLPFPWMVQHGGLSKHLAQAQWIHTVSYSKDNSRKYFCCIFLSLLLRSLI